MIEIKNAFKSFNNDQIKFKDIIFEDNKSYVIFGPSGCGKSTLLNILSGNIKVNGGTVEVSIGDKQYSLEELSKDKLQEFRRDNISYVSQDFNLFDNFSVYDNLDLINKIKKSRISVKEATELVGLSKKLKQKVKTLSGGEKQRVCIARALLQDSKVILCDEPTGSLNQTLANDIIKLIVQLHKKINSTLIVVTHDDRLIHHFDKVIYYKDFIESCIGGEN